MNNKVNDRQLNNFLDAHDKIQDVIGRGGSATKQERLEAMRDLTFEKAALSRNWSEDQREAEKEKFYKEYSIDRMMAERMSILMKAFGAYSETGVVAAAGA